MLKFHKEHEAEVTISVMQVPWDEASRFGILTAAADRRITEFAEKPDNPNSNLASMGIYIFNKSTLAAALTADSQDPDSEHDFGKNIIPTLLASGHRVFAYEFSGYWKDVGTIDSYHETSMELLDPSPEFDLYSEDFPVMSNSRTQPPHYVGPGGHIEESLVGNGSRILGSVRHSIIGVDCFVGEGAVVTDAVLLPGSRVEPGATVTRAILGENAVVQARATLGSADPQQEIAVIGDEFVVEEG